MEPVATTRVCTTRVGLQSGFYKKRERFSRLGFLACREAGRMGAIVDGHFRDGFEEGC